MDKNRSIDSIKIRLNEDIIAYLEFNRELDDEKSNSLSFMSARKKIEGDILLNIAV